jgi:malate dehydrogenase
VYGRDRIVPAAAYLQGHYGLEDIFIGVPTCLGREGVTRVLELDLLESEYQALHISATAVHESIKLAQSLIEKTL